MAPSKSQPKAGGRNFSFAQGIDFLPDATFAIDPQGKVIAWNKAIARLSGIQSPDMLGRGEFAYALPFYGTRRPILIDFALKGAPDAGKHYPPISSVNGFLVSEIEKIEIKHQSYYLWAAASRVSDAKGECIGAVEVIRDITEIKQVEDALRKSEQRFSVIFARAAVGICEMSPEGKFIKVNDTYCQILGRPRERLLAMSLPEVTHPDEVNRVRTALERVMEKGELESLDKKYVRPDGTIVYANCSLTRINEEQNAAQAILAVTIDLTERQRVNELLEQQVAERTQLAETRSRKLQALAVELIEAEERERRRIAQILHEDLQQITAAARFQLQTAQQNLPPDPMLAKVERLLEESIGKSRRLSYELNPAVLDHSGLLAALKWLAAHLSEQFGFQINLQLNTQPWQVDRIPMKVFIFRAAQELVFNVIKHSGAKSAQVALSCTENRLVLTVSDQGRGFDPRAIDSAERTSGLGLLSLRERSQYIGGTLDILSAPGQGSIITLVIPACMAESGMQELPAAVRLPHQRDARPDTGSIRVLFVDDHQLVRKGLIGLITSQPDIQLAGEAANGKEAIERACQLKPDVILMDISMPEMDGIEATRQIKAEMPDVRVIGLSMHEDEHLVRTMREAGAETFVNKAASSAELLKAIYGLRDRTD